MTDWKTHFYEVLDRRYKDIKARNPRFSIRAYARIAKVSPGAMSGLLNRTDAWSVTPERALSIFELVNADTSDINYLAAMTKQEVKYLGNPLPEEDHDILTDWTYLPILMSFDLSVTPTAQGLAEKLHLPVEKVNDVISDLLKRGLLNEDNDGNICRDKDQIWTSENGQGPTVEAIRKHHLTNLEMMAKTIREVPAINRDFSSMTFAGNLEQLALVKDEIKKFHERIFAIMDGVETKNEVFKVVIGVSPMTFETRN